MLRFLLLCITAVCFFTCSRPTSFSNGNERIKTENALPGTTDWLINVKFDTCALPDHRFCRRPQIEGYCSKTSVFAGDTIDFFISTNPSGIYSMHIYRMGYYQGKGATLKMKVDSLAGKSQVTPEPNPVTNFFEAGWDKSYSMAIPDDWLSGVYLCKLTTIPAHFQSYMIFIVKDKRKADFVFQCSDLTWQAYNRWPRWNSMYDEGHVPWVNTNGAKVSFDRPYAIYINELPSAFNSLSNGSGEFLLWEYPLCYWMEKEGYDVTYISNIDTHADSTTLMRTKAFLSVGHDEYWTYPMFDHVREARDGGVNLLFLSGNSVDGIEYLEPSTDGRPNRSTGRMPEREFTNEQELMGSTSWGVGYAGFVCQAPEHWVFAKTGMKKGDAIANLVGWEYHGRPAGHQPNLTILAESKVDPLNFGQGLENHIATIYTAPKGNYVFNAGTCFWVQPLAKTPAYQHPMKLRQAVDFSATDSRVQQITRNLFDKAVQQ